jgi:hypothetical protein
VTLVLVKPSIAPSTINDIKTTGVPLVLRAQGIPGASLNTWGIAGIRGDCGELGVKELQEAWPFSGLGLL